MDIILVPQQIDLEMFDRDIEEIKKARDEIEKATCVAELPKGVQIGDQDFDKFKIKVKKEADEAIDRKKRDKVLYAEKIKRTKDILKIKEVDISKL